MDENTNFQKKKYLLAIDQGTTSSRAILFSLENEIIATSQSEITQIYPQNGWVEHSAEEIWQSTYACCNNVIAKAKLSAEDILAIGITNQRETTILWDRNTGKPLYNAIVWQDRRTQAFCQELATNEIAKLIQTKTGLVLDPYFSASKISWILENIPDARAKAERGEVLFGTVDSYLLWRLTGGKSHITDITNAARTMLFNIETKAWDPELLALFAIPENILPQVTANVAEFGVTSSKLFGKSIPILAMAGDQHAATVGQACFSPGMVKATYGTGCFMLLNTGDQLLHSQNKLLTTIAYQVGDEFAYAIEGSIFIAGAAIHWLQDNLQIIDDVNQSEELVRQVKTNGGVYMVPAFTGLGAPHWDPNARGAIFGMTRDTQRAHIVRAALESVAYQTRDVLTAMHQDGAILKSLRVDGGMIKNSWFMQFLADVLHLPVDKALHIESSAHGIACLAGLGAGAYSNLTQIANLRQQAKLFNPNMSTNQSESLYQGWQLAVNRLGNEKNKVDHSNE